jgi:hypothetical protein
MNTSQETDYATTDRRRRLSNQQPAASFQWWLLPAIGACLLAWWGLIRFGTWLAE